MNKNTIVIYSEWKHLLASASDSSKARFLEALLDYHENTNQKFDDPMIQGVWNFISSQINKDIEKYEEMLEKRRNAGRKGGQAKLSKAKQSLAKLSKAKHNDNVNENDNDNVNKERIYTVDFEKFWELYPGPRKRKKPSAFSQWKEAIKRSDVDRIMQGLEAYLESEEVIDGYAPMPENWLKNDRWEDSLNENKQQEEEDTKLEEALKNAQQGRI